VLQLNKVGEFSHVVNYLDTFTNCSTDLLDLQMSLLEPNPKYRPTARQALSHPWFLEDRDLSKMI
jgi:serine/threonine protein kinase